MKIAYLIVAHNNPEHLKRLIQALDTEKSDFYIHFDKKTRNTFNLPANSNITVINNNIAVYWGGFSQVQASINLLSKAKSVKNYDYYILLSGVDYPVRSNQYIINFLHKHKGKEFIDLYKMPLHDKSFDRVHYYSLEGGNNKVSKFLITYMNKFIKIIGIKRRYPDKYSNFILYAGANWWGLTDSCVTFILKFIETNSAFVNFYKNTANPDEMFFQTIIGNSHFKSNVLNKFTYADWSGNPKPAIITKRHIDILKKEYMPTDFGNNKSYILFARKFTDNSVSVVNLIDIEFRND